MTDQTLQEIMSNMNEINEQLADLRGEYPTVGDRIAALERDRERLREWVREYEPTCVESIYQVDRVGEGLYTLGELVCEIVGYFDIDDEDVVAMQRGGEEPTE